MPAEQMQEASTHELSGQKTLVRSAYLTKAHGCFVVLGTDKFLLEWNDVRLGWFMLVLPTLFIASFSTLPMCCLLRVQDLTLYRRHSKYVFPIYQEGTRDRCKRHSHSSVPPV